MTRRWNVLNAGPILLLAVGVIGLTSCNSSTGPGAGSSPTGSAPPETDAKVEMKEVTVEQLTEEIKKHQGRVVLVDVWSTTCIPCLKKFHLFVDLQKKYGEKGLTCISVGLQDPEAYDTALGFLKKQKATFPNFVINQIQDNKDDKKLFRTLGGNGELPAVFLYNRMGEKIAYFDDKSTFEQIEKKVQEELVSLKETKVDPLMNQIEKLKGKVVVLDVWATWCEPCLKQFPDLVDLHKRYAEQGLVCVSVATQTKPDYPKTLKFLRDQDATFPNFVVDQAAGGEEAKLYETLRIRSALPSIFVFNRAGEKVGSFGEKNKREDLEKFVKQALRSGA